MLFTWDTTDLCIVFKQWHITGTMTLIWSLFAVVLLGIGYEGVRELSRRYELATSQKLDSLPSESHRGHFLCRIQNPGMSSAAAEAGRTARCWARHDHIALHLSLMMLDTC